MSFNSLGQYTANHKVWDHVGNIIPDVEHSEGERPAGEFRPAAWLPLQFRDKHYENYYVIMPGKPVACDPDGYLMPAEYGLTGASVVYAQADVDNGVIDVATGLPLTTAKTVVLASLTGVRGSSWTLAAAGTVDDAANRSGFMGRFGEAFGDASKKYTIGVAPYGYLQWAGGDGFNPANLRQHNYTMQHQTAVLCDYVIKLPQIPAQAATETVEPLVSGANLVFGTRDTHTRAQILANAEGRYATATGNNPVAADATVIALALDNENAAKNTARTTLVMASTNTADDVSAILLNEKSSVASITQAGDYYLDAVVGVLFLYSADGTTVPTAISGAAGTVSVTYYHYGAVPSTISRFAQVAGDVKCGDFLKVGASSNLVVGDPGSDEAAELIGQVIAIEEHPRDALDRVRTAYSPALGTDSSGSMANGVAGSASANLGQMDQMPGSATGGVTDQLHYAGAADRLVIINLVGR